MKDKMIKGINANVWEEFNISNWRKKKMNTLPDERLRHMRCPKCKYETLRYYAFRDCTKRGCDGLMDIIAEEDKK